METATQLPLINLNTLQPATAKELSLSIIDAVLSGYVNPLDLPVRKKIIEDALDSAMKNPGVRDMMIEEVQRHGKTASHLGAKIEVVEAGVKYHFENCSDPVLVELENKLSELSEKVKQRKDFLKALPESGEVITNQETGETNTVFPPYKTGTTTIKTSLK